MKKVTADSDTYLPILREHWDALAGMYVAFEDRAPMLEFNVVTGQIRAYAAEDYLEELSERTREGTKKQYKKAVAEGALMVFVRDESKEILRSYIFALAKGSSTRARRKESGTSTSNRAPGTAQLKSTPGMKHDISGTYAALHAIYSKHRRRHRENPDSKQMCCMWSTNDPPDIIEGTEPICDIEDAFGIQISDNEALELYDRDLDQAARMIIEIRKKRRMTMNDE